MFVPIVAGSDKTTVSVATGHQEYHPVYVSVGNLTNTAWRAHGNGVLPVACLPIPKSKSYLILFALVSCRATSLKVPAKAPRIPALLPAAVPQVPRSRF